MLVVFFTLMFHGVRMGTDEYGDGLFKIKPIFEFF